MTELEQLVEEVARARSDVDQADANAMAAQVDVKRAIQRRDILEAALRAHVEALVGEAGQR